MLFEYFTLLVPYFFIYCILCWGLNLQFGTTGIPNFTYMTFMAAGAYVTAVTALPPAMPGTNVEYILGLSWPFPLTLLAGGAAAGLLGWAFAALTFRRVDGTYLGIVTFGLGFIAWDLIATYEGVFNGHEGMAGVPQPLNVALGFDYVTYVRFFGVLTGVIAAMAWFVLRRIDKAALGRTLRSVREDPELAETLGKNSYRLRMTAMVVGSVLAGIGGGLIVFLVSAINPVSWSTPETFVVFAAVLLGGRGNNLGAMVGAFVVPVALFQLTRLVLPVPAGYVLEFQSLRLAAVGVLLILVLWFRDSGIVPERKGLVHHDQASASSRRRKLLPARGLVRR